MKLFVFCGASVVALLTSFLPASALAAPNKEQDLQEFVTRFATAWNQHDMDAFGKLFAPDADFVNVVGDRWTGRQSIQMQHSWTHGVIPRDTPGFPKDDPHYGIFAHSTLRFPHVDVRFLRKDVAVAHVDWELSGDSRATSPRRGVFLFVLTWQDGGWLIASAQNTEINRTVK